MPLFSEWRVRLSVLPYLNVHSKLPQKKKSLAAKKKKMCTGPQEDFCSINKTLSESTFKKSLAANTVTGNVLIFCA